MRGGRVQHVPSTGDVVALVWDGDDVVDPFGGEAGRRYGSMFDRAVVAPAGRYRVLSADRLVIATTGSAAQLGVWSVSTAAWLHRATVDYRIARWWRVASGWWRSTRLRAWLSRRRAKSWPRGQV
jgi:hypothetical protein